MVCTVMSRSLGISSKARVHSRPPGCSVRAADRAAAPVAAQHGVDAAGDGGEDLVDPGVVVVVEHPVRAESGDVVDVVGAGGGQHPHPCPGGELHRVGAGAVGGGGDQQRLVGLDLQHLVERLVGGQPADGKRRGLHERQAARLGRRLRGGDGAQLGPRPTLAHRQVVGEDRIPWREVGDLLAGLLDHTGALHAKGHGQRQVHREVPRADGPIPVADPADEVLVRVRAAGGRLGPGQLQLADLLRTAVPLDADRAHLAHAPSWCRLPEIVPHAVYPIGPPASGQTWFERSARMV